MRVIATVVSVLVVACGGPQWPGSVTTAAVAHHHGTVDLLPLDLEVWTEAGYNANVEQLRSDAETHITNAALAALTSHAYGIGAVIDWNGDYSGGHAIEHDTLRATIATLARYGSNIPDTLPSPHLPTTLGAMTGADATLYIGGWSFVANHRESTADKIAEGIAYALVIVAVIAVVAAISESGSHHHGAAAVSRSIAEPLAETALDVMVDAHPSWSTDPDLPHDGDSRMYLEMTLVDNHSGLALWHAHQQFPANATSGEDVERAANALLATLPST
jgi:hypothetical protein